MKIKRIIMILVIVLMFSQVACGTESKNPDTTSRPDIKQYDEYILVYPDNAQKYVKMAVDEMELFFLTQFQNVKKNTVSRYQPQENALVIFVGVSSVDGGYSVNYKDNTVNIQGADADLVYLATSRLINEYFAGNASNITVENIQQLNISQVGIDRSAYIQDISLFEPVWQYQWTPPEWMLDFTEKTSSYTVSGRMMCVAHRGGIQFYPENSIEAIISSIKMGCDIIEIDVEMTSDGRLVLLHGDLDVCTDWALKKGKNGLPKSNKVIAWTYEELQQLNLRFNYGQYTSAEGVVTSYKIPALDEVMTVCKDRIFVNIDKLDCVRYWDEVYAVLKATGTTQNYLFGKSFKDKEVSLTAYYQQMRADGLPVSMNYYTRWHVGNLEEDLTLVPGTKLEQFFTKYNNKGNNFLTDHPFECVQWISKQYTEG